MPNECRTSAGKRRTNVESMSIMCRTHVWNLACDHICGIVMISTIWHRGPNFVHTWSPNEVRMHTHHWISAWAEALRPIMCADAPSPSDLCTCGRSSGSDIQVTMLHCFHRRTPPTHGFFKLFGAGMLTMAKISHHETAGKSSNTSGMILLVFISVGSFWKTSSSVG